MTAPPFRVTLGVTGCIGAYKACEIMRGLQREGAEVAAVMTTAATRFLGPLTLQALSGRHVVVGALQDPGVTGVEHVDLARWADLLLVAPATANSLGKFAQGIADDFLSTLFTAVRCPVLLAPAMNDRMFFSPAVQENLHRLLERGVRTVGPGEGWLACRDEGWGRMAEPAEVVADALRLLHARATWRGRRVLVGAGPTREPLDAVRFLSNRSTGRMGYALAEAAALRAAQVVLVTGPTSLPTPAGVERVEVVTALEMATALRERFDACDVLIQCAAVADFRPAAPVVGKVKKEDAPLTLSLERNPDILRELGGRKQHQVLVGFAAETGSLEEEGRRKLKEKNLDLVVANDVGRTGIGFESADNEALLLARHGAPEALPRMSKRLLADRILDRVEGLLAVPRAEAGADG